MHNEVSCDNIAHVFWFLNYAPAKRGECGGIGEGGLRGGGGGSTHKRKRSFFPTFSQEKVPC